MNYSHPRIKFCGMTRRDDIDYALSLGVNALGFMFYEKSKRAIDIDIANSLMRDLPPFVTLTAVFVNPEGAFVKNILKRLPIQVLQFHGSETVDFCSQFGLPYIKAVPVESLSQVKEMSKVYFNANAILLDKPSPEFGGTGETFNWNEIPEDLTKPVILSGGLTSLNVANAMKIRDFYALDVSSGIESSYGIKDYQKMKDFIQAVRGDTW